MVRGGKGAGASGGGGTGGVTGNSICRGRTACCGGGMVDAGRACLGCW